jgi:hypothetical protein
MKLFLHSVEIFLVFITIFPKEIQPTEAVAMLQYATTLHPDLSFLLMERRPKSLQKYLMMLKRFNTISKHVKRFEMRGWMLQNMRVNMNKN